MHGVAHCDRRGGRGRSGRFGVSRPIDISLEAAFWRPKARRRGLPDTDHHYQPGGSPIRVLPRQTKDQSADLTFWTTLRRIFSRWADVLVIVKPETVVGWHRAGFRRYLNAVAKKIDPLNKKNYSSVSLPALAAPR